MSILEAKERDTQNELDNIVLNIELTLISIIQGVALYFLAENAKKILLQEQWVYFPYVATGLVIILTFWSRSIIHTLTVIRWPLKFGHNFLYITATFVETVSFNQLDNPLHWFFLQGVFAILLWLLFMSDLTIIRRRLEDSKGPATSELCGLLQKDQWRNIRFLFPINIFFNFACYALIKRDPQVFLADQGHVCLAIFQLLSAAIYLTYGIYFYQKIIPRISQTRREWRDDTLIQA